MSEIIGLDNLERKLTALAKALSKDEFLESAKDGMTIYVEGPAKRNAPVGKSRPGYTGGRLRGSITSTIDEDKAITGTNVEYGPRVELGFNDTDSLGRKYNQAPKPYLRPAWDEGKSKVVEHMEEQAVKNIRSIL